MRRELSRASRCPPELPQVSRHVLRAAGHESSRGLGLLPAGGARGVPKASRPRGLSRDASERMGQGDKLSDFQALLAINISRLSAKELHRRHQPVMTLFVPLIERGQQKGVFRSDLPVSWHLAMLRAIAHAASAELRSGRIDESTVEDAMISTAMNALSPQ